MKKLLQILIIFFLFNNAYTQITTIGNTFSPDTLNVTVGDTVTFTLGATHNAVGVSQNAWMANNYSQLVIGGINIGTGLTGYYIPTVAQTYYYVCQAHVAMGMKGIIIASSATVPQTYVPDSAFEAYLENNGMGNGIPNDNYVTTSNIQARLYNNEDPPKPVKNVMIGYSSNKGFFNQ